MWAASRHTREASVYSSTVGDVRKVLSTALGVTSGAGLTCVVEVLQGPGWGWTADVLAGDAGGNWGTKGNLYAQFILLCVF